MGEFVMKSRIHVEHLMRLARDPKASIAERIKAEFHASQIEVDLISTLQSAGYVPQLRPLPLIDQSTHLHVTSVSQQIREVLNVDPQAADEGRTAESLPPLP